MPALIASKVIRRLRQRLELSQEGLSRLLNATKGAVQHWERGRNNPDLARLLALRQLCPPGRERKQLGALIRAAQAVLAGLPVRGPVGEGRGTAGFERRGTPLADKDERPALLQRQNSRLERQVARLEATLERRNEQLRLLEKLATDLERQLARLRAGQSEKRTPAHGPA